MTKARRSFTDEFKREAVALLQTSGRPLIQIASELGIQRSMLRNWRDVAELARWGSGDACGGVAALQYAGGSSRRQACPMSSRPRLLAFVGKSSGCA
jgi:transposase-like protein